MLTKFYLDIDGASNEIPQVCIKNWDDIKCSYKRSDFSGVTRSFTSQFEFVGDAYYTLMSLYMRDGFNAQAKFSLYTITDTWQWIKQFSCVLDFSTIVWDNNTLKINCVDNNLAAHIKANKGTKYEWKVADEIVSNGMMTFNRLPMKNSITYEFTGGESLDDGSLKVPPSENNRSYLGVVSDDEVLINGMLFWNDDQTTEADGYMVSAVKDIEVEVDFTIVYDQSWRISRMGNNTGTMDCKLKVVHSNNTETLIAQINISNGRRTFVGIYSSEEALKTAYPNDKIYTSAPQPFWALINHEVWEVHYYGSPERTYWENTHIDESTFRHFSSTQNKRISLKKSDKIVLFTESTQTVHIYSSSIKFSWMATANPVSMHCFKPATIANALLRRIGEGGINASVVISDYDARLAKTYIVAAESIRGIPGAKIYTSFNEFVDWMATVFGYTYYLGEETKSGLKYHQQALGGVNGTPYGIDDTPWMNVYSEPPTAEQIYYCSWCGVFAARDDGGKYYRYFPGWENYNHQGYLKARMDTVFTIKRHDGEKYVNKNYYFVSDPSTIVNYTPFEYEGDLADIEKPMQKVYFVHRSEIFNPNANVKHIKHVRDVQYTVESSTIYASVNIGYEKKDYETVNGRDEFNFNNTYTTGCSVTDKKLSLISKYRADSYGFEFAAQKQGADTTDTTSDNDVFFAYCKRLEDGTIVPDNSITIENAFSDSVFNGVFSPMACVQANAGYIGMQSANLHLKFASSDGNSEVVVDGIGISSDIDLSTPLITSGVVEFSTDDVDEPASFDDIVEFESNGVVYRGFVLEAKFRYGKVEAADYKLIVKEIEI